MGVVVDSQVEVAVIEAGISAGRPDDQQGGGLLSPAAAAGAIPSLQGGEQTIDEGPGGRLEGLRHRRHPCLADQDVALAPAGVAGPAPKPRKTLRAPEGRRPTPPSSI